MLPVTALVGAGCAADSRAVEDDVDTESAALDGTDPSSRGGPPPGGPHALFVVALEVPTLTDGARATIEAALDSIRPPRAEEARHRARAAALAAAVRRGSVDVASLRPEEAEIEEHETKMVARMQAALITLHGALSADERAAVVARLRERRPTAGADQAPPGPPPGPRSGGHLARVLDGLEVDDAQREKIEAAVSQSGLGEPTSRPEPPDPATFDAFLDAFVSSSFDPGALPPPPPRPESHRLEVLAVITPLLSSDQRDALADRILEGPPRPPAHP